MIKKEYEFSSSLRFTHWIRAIAIVVLIVTGFYIAYPFITVRVNSEPTNFLYALTRAWHGIFGFILIAVTLFKMYIFFFDRESQKERVSFWDFLSPKMWFKQIKYYLLVGEHAHLKGAYNPLQFMAYAGIYIALLLISLTGLILYMHTFHDGLGGMIYESLRPFEYMLGGLANIRLLHHIAMWIFIIFLPIHIYLSIFNSVYGKSGAMDSIISGYKWEEKK